MSGTPSKSGSGSVTAATGVVLLLAALVGAPLICLHLFGLSAPARIVNKQERFALSQDGWWRHELELTYAYRPADAAADMTVSDLVDSATFDALRIGDTAAVRYSRVAFLRYAHPYGSKIEQASTWSRFSPSTDDVTTLDLLLAGLAIVLTAAAYRTNLSVLVGAATAAVATVGSAVILVGPFVLALVFGIWFARRRAAFGWGLLTALLLIPQLLWTRIPHPPAEPAGSVQQASGRVRDMRTITAVWEGYRESGQPVPLPFDVADVAFTPSGSTHEVHVVDRVDSGSVPLRRGSEVTVQYPRGEPERGRLASGERTYDRRLFTYILEISYGGAAVLAFVVAPAWLLATRWFRRLPVVRRVSEPRQQLAALAELPGNDPRRVAIIARLRERGVHIPPDALRPTAGDGGDAESSQKRGC